MSNFYLDMLPNLQMVGIVFAIFIFSVVANILVSSFYNINILKERWNTKRFVTGFIKMLILGISTGILSIIVTTIPYVLSLAGISITPEMEQIYTIVAIIGLYANGILKYYKKSFMTVKEIIEDKDIIEDVEELEINFEQEEENNEEIC